MHVLEIVCSKIAKPFLYWWLDICHNPKLATRSARVEKQKSDNGSLGQKDNRRQGLRIGLSQQLIRLSPLKFQHECQFVKETSRQSEGLGSSPGYLVAQSRFVEFAQLFGAVVTGSNKDIAHHFSPC